MAEISPDEAEPAEDSQPLGSWNIAVHEQTHRSSAIGPRSAPVMCFVSSSIFPFLLSYLRRYWYSL